MMSLVLTCLGRYFFLLLAECKPKNWIFGFYFSWSMFCHCLVGSNEKITIVLLFSHLPIFVSRTFHRSWYFYYNFHEFLADHLIAQAFWLRGCSAVRCWRLRCCPVQLVMLASRQMVLPGQSWHWDDASGRWRVQRSRCPSRWLGLGATHRRGERTIQATMTL